VLQSLKERGVLEQILNSLNTKGDRVINNDTTTMLASKSSKRFLHIKLMGGKAFLDFVEEEKVRHNRCI
jgi:hypothetical protein